MRIVAVSPMPILDKKELRVRHTYRMKGEDGEWYFPMLDNEMVLFDTQEERDEHLKKLFGTKRGKVKKPFTKEELTEVMK